MDCKQWEKVDWKQYYKHWDEWLLLENSRYEIIFTPEEIGAEQFLRKPLRVIYELENMSKISIYTISSMENINDKWCPSPDVNNIPDDKITKEGHGFVFNHSEYVKEELTESFNMLKYEVNVNLSDGIKECKIIFDPDVWKKEFLTEEQYKEYTISKREDKLKRITK